MRRDFVANVSHELRTPLTIVGGFAETLQDPEIPAGKRAEFARTIYSNTQRMQRIVDELLDLSRIESGHWKPRPQPVKIAEVSSEIFGRVAHAASTKGVALDTRLDPSASIIHADRTAVEQILLNLIENALRHTSEAGRITVETTPALNGVVLDCYRHWNGHPRRAPAKNLRAVLPRRQWTLARRRRHRIGPRDC